jgi:hypothetical protein
VRRRANFKERRRASRPFLYTPSPLFMRPVRKIAFIVVSIVVALIVVLATIPFFFADKIAARLKAQVDQSVNARVAWSGIDLSLLRDFPNVTASVNGLRVAGVQRFERDTLVTMEQAKLVLDLGSVVGYLRSGKPIVVREITFEKPVVRLKRLADGTANWDIAKATETSASSSSSDVSVTLRGLAIHDGVLTLDDDQSQLTASLHGLDEAASGDFATQKFVLATRTSIDSVSVRFAGVPYLNRVAVMLHANVDADLGAKRFTLKDDSLRLNKLLVTASGSVTTGSPNLDLDLKFAAPSTAFAEILSLVPAIYAKDFAKLQTSGTMALNGQVKGAYGPKAFPAFAVRARVDNGTFRYPDLPLGARDIGLELALDNPGGDVDRTVVDLKKFHALIGDRPLDATLLVRTPVSDPDADVRIAGSVNLGDIAKTVKLEGVTQLSGVVSANVATRVRVSDVNAKRYDRVTASGAIQASRVAVQSSAVPYPIAIDTAALTLTPRSAALTAFSAKIGGSDARATGSLDNLMGFLLHNEDLRGTATVSSNRFVLDEWKSDEKMTDVIPVPPRIDFGLAANANTVIYGPLSLANVTGNLQVKNQRVTMRDLKMDMLKGAVVANGFYDTTDPAKPAFGMDVKMTTLDIPAAFASLVTVQKLTPIAKWAQGNVSGTLALNGTLGTDMTPVFSALTGRGEIATQRLLLSDSPVLTKLSKALSMDALKSPRIGAVRAAFDVSDGRVRLKPMSLKLGGVDMTASGSSGIDQSVQYDLALSIPRELLGSAATSAITQLAAKAGSVGATLPAGEVVQLLAKVGGTVTDPNVSTNFAGMAASLRDATQNAAKQIAATAVETATAKKDSVVDAVSQQARERADSLVAAATRQADTLRSAARQFADKVRQDANTRIDSLVAKATNPIAKLAAQKAADKLRSDADQQANKLVREADTRADSLVAQARLKAAALAPPPK